MRGRALAVVAVVCLSACAADHRPSSADVYFRPFHATSIVRLSESSMVTSAGSEFHITDRARLLRIRSLVSSPCQPSSLQPEEMDLRLLIYFNDKDGRTTWKATPFAYYNGFTGKMCEMTPALLAALSREFGGEQPVRP